ncbi:MAG TPA: hypothetical protein VGH00_09825 [Chthoniobacterales bacterium]|jgi:hypothetical protein
MGCFAKGCLTVLILGFLFIAVVGGGCWYFYKKTFNNLTSLGPTDIRVETPTPAQTKSAEDAHARLDEAIARNQETSVEFTGPELNHLLAQNSDLEFLRGRSRIDIADSTMTVALSAPLDRLPWPGLKDRWFNGTLRFGMTYGSGVFQLDLKSAEANGHEFPTAFLSSFNSSFNESMNKAFREEVDRNQEGNEFWNHVKSVSLQGDKLVITTKAQ